MEAFKEHVGFVATKKILEVTMESTIIEKIRQLPPELQEEVIHFIDFLRTKKIGVQNGANRTRTWSGLAA